MVGSRALENGNLWSVAVQDMHVPGSGSLVESSKDAGTEEKSSEFGIKARIKA